MEKIHTTQPEAVVFLELAVREMERYKKIHGNYSSGWYLMDIPYANGPYRITDDGIRPVKDMKKIWKPKNSGYTYKLKSANKNEFSISAINKDGDEEYVIEQGMNSPQMKSGPGADAELGVAFLILLRRQQRDIHESTSTACSKT